MATVIWDSLKLTRFMRFADVMGLNLLGVVRFMGFVGLRVQGSPKTCPRIHRSLSYVICLEK